MLEVGDVRLDPERHEVEIRGEQVRLPLKEFELLEILLSNAGRVLPRETLIDRVWGTDYVGDTKTLDVHIKRLRAKVEKDPSVPTRIVTIRGLGYKYDTPKTAATVYAAPEAMGPPAGRSRGNEPARPLSSSVLRLERPESDPIASPSGGHDGPGPPTTVRYPRS